MLSENQLKLKKVLEEEREMGWERTREKERRNVNDGEEHVGNK